MIQTESTPNPNSLKISFRKCISAAGTEEFQKDKLKIYQIHLLKNF